MVFDVLYLLVVVDDGADDEVYEQERRDHNPGDLERAERPQGMASVGELVAHLGPVIAGEDAEEREARLVDAGEVFLHWVTITPEQLDPDDGVDIEQDRREERDVFHAGDRPHEHVDDEPQFRYGFDQPQHSEYAQGAKNRTDSAGRRDQRGDDDDQIKDVPTIAEEGRR